MRFAGDDARRAAEWGYEVRTDADGWQYAVPAGTPRGSLEGATPKFNPATAEVRRAGGDADDDETVEGDSGDSGASSLALGGNLSVPMREQIERFAAERHNHDRARAFGAPVLRSRHPEALLVGYSITGEIHPPRRPYDRIVEANHVALSSVGSAEPVSFTTRSWKAVFSDDEFLLHAMDDLGNSTPRRMGKTRETFRTTREVLQSLPRREVQISIDGEVHGGVEFEHLGSVFVRLPGFGGAELITIAAPREFVEAGFWSDVPG